MEAAAANVITDAVRSYARKRARSTKTLPKTRSAWRKGVVSKMPSTFKFTRFVSTGQSGAPLYVGTGTTGIISFLSGSTQSPSLSLSFSLDALRVNLGSTQIAAVVVPNYTEFGALFDKFRIDKVDVYYTSSVYSNGAMGANQSMYMPACAYTVDTDDANAATCSDLQQYSTCKYTQFGGNQAKPKLLASFKPMPSLALYSNGTTVSGVGDLNSKNLWLDCGTPGTYHYGMKFGLDQVSTTLTAQTWYMINFQVRYHLCFKDVR